MTTLWQAYQDAFNSIEASFFKPVQTHKCVHTEHCCIGHGCKYGGGYCVVYRGYQAQSHPCEDCHHGGGFFDIENPAIPRVTVEEIDRRRKKMSMADMIADMDDMQ
jgi:hypothetical protein